MLACFLLEAIVESTKGSRLTLLQGMDNYRYSSAIVRVLCHTSNHQGDFIEFCHLVNTRI